MFHQTDPRPRIGIDLGGTKTEVIALSSTGDTLLRERVATPSHSYDAIVRTVAALTRKAVEVTGTVPHVGVGVPGAPDQRTGKMKNANTTCLIGQPLADDLKSAIGCPVILENDANCFTLSEAVDGAGRGRRVVFGVILGTGVGGGWAIDGKPHAGMHHIGGEWGHNAVPLRLQADPAGEMQSILTQNTAPETRHIEQALEGNLPGFPFVALGRRCYCGLSDCVETHLCGAGLQRTHAWVSAGIRKNRYRTAVTPRTAQEIAGGAQSGDHACQITLSLYAQQLACCLSTVINIMDPDVIVLGGGVSNIDALYPHLQPALNRWVFNDRVLTPVLKARHGDSSGVRGAAWL